MEGFFYAMTTRLNANLLNSRFLIYGTEHLNGTHGRPSLLNNWRSRGVCAHAYRTVFGASILEISTEMLSGLSKRAGKRS